MLKGLNRIKIVYLFAFLVMVQLTLAQSGSSGLLQVINTKKDDTSKVRLLMDLAETHQTTSIVDALSYANKALEMAKKLRWPAGEINAEFSLGKSHVLVQEYPTALNHFQRSLQLAEKYNNKPAALKNLFEIAETYSLAKDFEKTMFYKKATLKLAEEIKDRQIETQTLNFMAGTYFNNRQYALADAYWKKCLEAAFNSEKKNRPAMVLNNLAELNIAEGDLDTAKIYLTKALQLIAQTNDASTNSYIHFTSASLYAKRQQVDSAIAFAGKALTLSQEGNRLEIQENALKLLSELYEKRNPQKSLNYLKAYYSIRDSIANHEQQRQNLSAVLKFDFTKQQAIHEAEKKSLNDIRQKQRLALLVSAIGIVALLALLAIIYTQLKRNRTKNNKISNLAAQLGVQKQALEKSLNEKELLLKEIHHRVKNNLQVISSLLELQTANGGHNEAIKAAITEGQNRVKSIALIHQRLYQHENLSAIEFGRFVEELFSQVASVLKKPGQQVQTSFSIPETYVDIDTAVPLGLICNEIITNAFKYAFANDRLSHFNVQLRVVNGYEHELFFADNGPGLPKDVGWEKADSLGLRLIHRLSRQIGGEAFYIYDRGTKFTIRFPRQNAQDQNHNYT